jgi:CUB domain
MYFPEECVSTSVSGFNEGLIVSQRGYKYLPNTACTMYLSVRATSKSIRFIFEHMDLPESNPGDCEDYIQFYASDNDGWTTIGQRICGYAPPEDLVSHVTNVSVVFTSDGFRERTGFRFRFRLERPTEVCAPGRGCIPQNNAVSRIPPHISGYKGAGRYRGML